MKFLGSCRVCGKPIHNYIGFAQHLRNNQDAEHQQLKKDWNVWRSEYRATLCCIKCGGLWEITDKKQKDKKRCPSCQKIRDAIGKRQYEKYHPNKKPDPRPYRPKCGSKAQYDGLNSRELVWKPDDTLCLAVAEGLKEGLKVNQILRKIGLSFNVFKEIAEYLLGKEEYKAWAYERIRKRTVAMAEKAHEKYRNMSPEEKTAFFSKFKRGSKLEKVLATQLQAEGLSDFAMNVWQSVPVKGKMSPREADIKLSVGDGRKLIILCDGVAFHGPGTIYGDPSKRIQEDTNTAEAYFQQGYSVIRVSELEVKTGQALILVRSVLDSLKTCRQVYRNWCPLEERVV